MENGNSDLSSSLSFGSYSYLSNGSSFHDKPSTTGYEVGPDFEFLSLSKLSSSLENLVVGSEYDYSDAEIEVEGITIGVYRGILAARSPFFHEIFKNRKDDEGSVKEGGKAKPKYILSELVPHGRIAYEVFLVVLSYLYTGKFKAPPPEVSTCVDASCTHDACVPAISYAVEMMYACATFQIKELVQVVERRLLDYVDKIFMEDVIPILKAAYHFGLNQLVAHCVQTIARVDVDDVIIEKALPTELVADIRSARSRSNYEEEHDSSQVNLMNYLNSKTMRRIYRALDSDDVELLKLLLDESKMSLDDAYALHYSAAFCSPKTFDEVCSLGKADLNLRNARGYTVLHIAARQKDPSIVLRVLEHGACVFDVTRDGRTAVTIRRRMTRPKDFNEVMKHGKETNMDRLCIDVLEREMRGNPLAGGVSMSSMMVADDLYMRLLLLENRVAMARSLFPVEARLSMHIAYADLTSEFAGLSASKESYGNFREVDLKELPSDQVKSLQQRLQALQKAVEANHRFFPNCSEVLDRLLEDDTLGDMLLEKGSPEEQRMKRTRYLELKEDLMNAFDKDIAENNLPGILSSTSCSSSLKGHVMMPKGRKRY
ncbi:regulatory protein npr3 [Phtheirospermum japonicum]|uniref:Regulatory protein npr3 n=1 Tax=Phtheirospermum japonicum TaxID=374723 RepID=A0A830CEA2_9LAMI|nr:regulatory protein npr3 [Phtheirospermum japonicum]